MNEVSVTTCYLYGKAVFFAGGNKIYKVILTVRYRKSRYSTSTRILT